MSSSTVPLEADGSSRRPIRLGQKGRANARTTGQVPLPEFLIHRGDCPRPRGELLFVGRGIADQQIDKFSRKCREQIQITLDAYQ